MQYAELTFSAWPSVLFGSTSARQFVDCACTGTNWASGPNSRANTAAQRNRAMSRVDRMLVPLRESHPMVATGTAQFVQVPDQAHGITTDRAAWTFLRHPPAGV